MKRIAFFFISTIIAINSIAMNKKLIPVAVGHCHLLIISNDYQVLSYGYGGKGQLGHNSTDDILELNMPKAIQLFKDKAPSQVVAGGDFSLVLCADGSVYSFGTNLNGELGYIDNNLDHKQTVPRKIERLEEEHIIQMAAGEYHGLAAYN